MCFYLIGFHVYRFPIYIPQLILAKSTQRNEKLDSGENHRNVRLLLHWNLFFGGSS